MGWLIKDHDVARFVADWIRPGMVVVDAGAGRFGVPDAIGLDLRRLPTTDVVGDLHHLPVADASVDAVVCGAVLQYCRHPDMVLAEVYRVLRPGGLVYLDVPWVQPYCPDGLDRWRFSEGHLRELLADFETVQLGPSIRPGSALRMQAVYLARSTTRWRAVNAGLALLVRGLTVPLARWRGHDPAVTAGAFYAVARKP